ncbi:MAG: copper ion binding protein, partial [Tuberibacillus sp.]
MTQTKEISLDITGMTCAACSNRIEKVLNKMDGVEANVNLALENAKVKYDQEKTKPTEIVEKIEKLGYGVREEKAEFDIRGMTCAACSNRIEKALNKMDGVERAVVNLATESATVEYIFGSVTIEEMTERVKKLGYEAIPKTDANEETDYKEKEYRKKLIQFIISAVLTIPFIYMMMAKYTILPNPMILENPWLQLIMAGIVQFYIGGHFYL